MPIARIQMPDGRIARLEVPDGTTPAQVEEFVAAQGQSMAREYKEPTWIGEARAKLDPTIGMSTGERVMAGYGAAAPNIAMGIGQRLGMVDQADVDSAKRLQAPLMNTRAGFVGNLAGNVAAAVPTAAIPGANTVAGAGAVGAGLGFIQPTATGESVAVNTVLGGAAGALGQAAAKGIGGGLAKRAAKRAAQGQQSAVRDATMKLGQKAGYVVAPANANPTAWNRLLQGLAGKTATGQRAAMMNQETTNKLVRQTLGLADDAPLTEATLANVRKEAGKAYEVLRGFDDIAFDQQYADDLLEAAKPYMDTAAELPELASAEIQTIFQMANRPGLSGNGLIAATRLIRDKAKAAFKAGETEAGRFYRGVSDAMEEAAERFLAQSGDDAAATSFRDARQLIAKAHTVEAALNKGNGNVIASKLASQLDRGKPLSGELKQIGQFSRAFPRETQEVANSSWLQMPGPSPLDYAAGMAASLGTGNPMGMAATVARPLVNALITSRPYQAAMTTPQYAQGAIANALARAADSGAGQFLARQVPANALLLRPSN